MAVDLRYLHVSGGILVDRQGRGCSVVFVERTGDAVGGGVAVASVDGSQVGDAFDPLAEGKPTTEVHLDDVFGVRSVAPDVPTSFPGIVDPGVEMAYGVIAWCEKGGQLHSEDHGSRLPLLAHVTDSRPVE